MNNLTGFWKLLPLSTKFLLLAVVLAFVVMISLLIGRNSPDKEILPSPSASVSTKLNVLQRSEPNKAISEIESRLSVTQKEASSDGSVVYSLQSDNPARPDQVITKNGKVIFERIYIPDSPTAPGYMVLGEVEVKYGEAEAVEQGSKFWGGFMKTYIYASKGYAFIANPYTKEVFEMHVFSPTDVTDYKERFGSDISGKEPVGEGL